MTPTRPIPDPAVRPQGVAALAASAEGRRVGPDRAPPLAGLAAAPLPEPARLAAHAGALAALRAVQRALAQRLAGQVPDPIPLAPLPAADLALLARLLGEGEVAARVRAPREGDAGLQAQESVFAGVWRVVHTDAGGVRDTLEVGPVPAGLLEAARRDARTTPAADVARPPDLMNAPAVLEELRDRARTWRPGDRPHVVNLTLLPLSRGDADYIDARLGVGRVTILSRGYANCRVVDTLLPRTWRVTYCSAADQVILDTLEVGLVPEVACAAPQDLEDSAERLDELLTWADSA